MNRLASPLEDTLTPASFDQTSLSLPSHDQLPAPATSRRRSHLTTFAPIHYERGYSYPLLVWLHGAGGNERQLLQLMPLISVRNHVAVAPRGTVVGGEEEFCFAWSQSREHIESAERRVFDAIDEATRRFSVHSRRIFVAGYGCGGTMAVRLAWKHPQRFAGAATLGGALPQGMCPLARVNELRRLPLLISAGRDARGYHQQRLCDDLRLLHSAGFCVAVRQYPCGDELCTVMLSDLDRWVMEIVCGKSMLSSAR
jgi:phospholipase/carboxylesterase